MTFIKKIKNSNSFDYFIRIGYLLLGSLFFPTILASLLFIFNISIFSLEYFLGIIILLITYYCLFYDKSNKKSFYIPIIISFLLIICCFISTYFIYDFSWDGQAYHLPAVIKLKEGLNPIYDHFDNEEIIGIWSEHYPKFIWIYGSMLYKITGNFYIAGSFNLIFILSSLFICLSIFKNKEHKYLGIIFSIIVAFNIISVSQAFTMYNDGVLGLSIIMVILLYRYLIKNNYSELDRINPYVLLIAFYLSILANIKYTGALFAFLLFIVFSLVCIYKKMIKVNKKILPYILTIGLSVVIVASNTYLTNLIYHKNPGYPIIGNDKIDIIEKFVPKYVENDGKIISFIKSFTANSKKENYKYNPFYLIKSKDIKCAAHNDCRINGFGPFYQLIVILILFVIVIDIINNIRNRISFKDLLKKYYLDLICLIVLLVMFFITPDVWWSRYVPYMYLFPFLIINMLNIEWNKNTLKTFCASLLIAIYLLQSMIIGAYRLKKSYKTTIDYKKEIKDISKNYNGEKLLIKESSDIKYYVDFVSEEVLRNNNIKYERTTNNCKVKNSYPIINIDICDGDSNEEN